MKTHNTQHRWINIYSIWLFWLEVHILYSTVSLNRRSLPAAGHWRGRPLFGAGTVSAYEACWRQAPQTDDSSTPAACGVQRGSTEARLKRWRWQVVQRTDCGGDNTTRAGSSLKWQEKRKHFSHKYDSQFSGPGWTAPHGSHRWRGLHWSGVLFAGSFHKCLRPSLCGCLLHHPHLKEQWSIKEWSLSR